MCARTVARFSEKPDAATALDLMAAGALWNSGLFAWTAARLLAEVARHTPEVAPALPAARGGDVRRLLPRRSTPISIDVGLLERSGAVAVVTGAFAWDDVGTWQALTRVRPKDPSGNVVVGTRGPAGVARLHRLDRPRSGGPLAGCRTWSSSRPTAGSCHADRARRRDEAPARRPAARYPRRRA